ncbi:myosin light chain kinase 2, skeletal/cardiac muscle isoform X2 [Bufo bufo]|nr:myosin light chain kinase 2, skeletal/cardiac muscle isoform X2 [Bufo bufo]XP_040291091.1 myosin light chain kinase 2, skeletal/cardiac muscle isoform X2 [Bufo bufo]XP_040291092.1 myosin light chain kinase 2, skeletal/cardiac muscle isoform X2 [Bufo bufo]XP_040291093.1 myosin light chain kinase 2, skeletal/cardiac muscle isoform X2 [Bufo bufo]
MDTKVPEQSPDPGPSEATLKLDMDSSLSTKKDEGQTNEEKNEPPTQQEHRNEGSPAKEAEKPADVQGLKPHLKLVTANHAESSRVPLVLGDVDLSILSPGIKFGVPLSPSVLERDLQSPVVIIGQDVFKIIDDCPPPPAPFPHRMVTLRTGNITDLYDLNMDEILGGGRFGEVHLCKEKSSSLQLVAKVMKVQSERDREMALNEVNVMNQLDHPNIIQMFDAVETPTEIFLFLEYVAGGELFERIIDDSYQLMEVDAMVFVRQICEGIFYMHQMYVLHLDLKPENIVCVSPISHKVKIIDFGLARRYKPQNKLKVSFGTAEFLSPEVINFDNVSFKTDMWSVGVITYMMVSGLSPFLGANDAETMNSVLSGEADFDEEPFELVSEEAKDFISNLLVREKSGRMSAGQCLKHPWLNDLARKAKLCNRLLKSQMELRKYMMRRRWKKNMFAVAAANRFRKSGSTGCLTSLVE